MSLFSRAFNKARQANKSMFQFNGHWYSTRNNNESDTDWNNFLNNASDSNQYKEYINGNISNTDSNIGPTQEQRINDWIYFSRNGKFANNPINPNNNLNPSVAATNNQVRNQLNTQFNQQFTPQVNTPINVKPITLPQQQQQFDRSDIRSFLRKNNINPYSLSGSERRAIRMVANNTANQADKDIFSQIKNKYNNVQWTFKNGGMINYYQQGGAAEQDPQQQIIALVQAAMQGDEKATQQIKQIQAAAEQGDKSAAQIMQYIQQIMQQMQQQAQKAKRGAKLQYLAQLRGECPEGTHMEYFKAGGQICKKCMQNKVQEDKCGGKAKKQKMACGGATKTINSIKSEMEKCGGKMKKKK